MNSFCFKSIVSDINIAVPAFFRLLFAQYIFHTVIFNSSCVHMIYIAGLCIFKTNLAIFVFVTGKFIQCHFMIVDLFGFVSTIVSDLSHLSSFFLLYLLLDGCGVFVFYISSPSRNCILYFYSFRMVGFTILNLHLLDGCCITSSMHIYLKFQCYSHSAVLQSSHITPNHVLLSNIKVLSFKTHVHT